MKNSAGALTPEELAGVQQQVRARVLRWFARAGHLDPGDAGEMRVGLTGRFRARDLAWSMTADGRYG